MRRLQFPVALLSAASVLIFGSPPAQAHGSAGTIALSGLLHPLLAPDHLLLLLAVATAASLISAELLLWAAGGAVIGACLGVQGFSLAAGELIAALMVAAVGGLLAFPALTRLGGPLVAVAVASHAWLHGLEAPAGASGPAWWLGALAASLAVLLGATLALRTLPRQTSRWATALFITGGLGLAAAALLLQAGGAAA
jgi:urease accessory protein